MAKVLNTGIERFRRVSQEVPPGSGGAWLKSAAECFVAPIVASEAGPVVGGYGNIGGGVTTAENALTQAEGYLGQGYKDRAGCVSVRRRR